MLEVQAHQQLKHLLRADAGQWEHQLTLSRLVGRSLRRRVIFSGRSIWIVRNRWRN